LLLYLIPVVVCFFCDSVQKFRIGIKGISQKIYLARFLELLEIVSNKLRIERDTSNDYADKYSAMNFYYLYLCFYSGLTAHYLFCFFNISRKPTPRVSIFVSRFSVQSQ